MDIKIRRAQNEEELKACAELFTDNDPWKKIGETYEYNYDKVHSPGTEVYVAMDNDRVAGCLLLEMDSTLKAFVRGLVVSEEYRSKKIGSALLKHIEERVFSETKNVFLFCSSERGHRFYKANGYEEIGVIKDLNQPGMHETIFRKTIGTLH